MFNASRPGTPPLSRQSRGAVARSFAANRGALCGSALNFAARWLKLVRAVGR
jgi:hypothetical protein